MSDLRVRLKNTVRIFRPTARVVRQKANTLVLLSILTGVMLFLAVIAAVKTDVNPSIVGLPLAIWFSMILASYLALARRAQKWRLALFADRFAIRHLRKVETVHFSEVLRIDGSTSWYGWAGHYRIVLKNGKHHIIALCEVEAITEFVNALLRFDSKLLDVKTAEKLHQMSERVSFRQTILDFFFDQYKVFTYSALVLFPLALTALYFQFQKPGLRVASDFTFVSETFLFLFTGNLILGLIFFQAFNLRAFQIRRETPQIGVLFLKIFSLLREDSVFHPIFGIGKVMALPGESLKVAEVDQIVPPHRIAVRFGENLRTRGLASYSDAAVKFFVEERKFFIQDE